MAIGLAFIFGVTAALASVITEMIARFLGLRGAYLLAGLRELLDSRSTPVALGNAENDFKNAQALFRGVNDAPKPSSATSALLGSPILSSQGMTGTISARQLMVMEAKTKVMATDEGKPAESDPQKTLKPPKTFTALNSLNPRNWLRTWHLRQGLPSYIASRSFAEAVVDLVIPDKSGQTNMAQIQDTIDQLQLPPDSPLGPLKASLGSLAKTANGDVTRFRTSIENWYDDHMARVSGWYKRRTTWITFGVGLVLVLLLNVNAITVGRALYSDSAARTAVSTLAAKSPPCPASQNPKSQVQQNCLERLERQVSGAAQAGLPLGWEIVPACVPPKAGCSIWERYGVTPPGDGSPWQVILFLIGFLATIVALAPGAQFWFGLVVKLNSLRSTGPPPATSGTSAT
ncbi:MAG TPA: hypothetical protein VFW50_39000 [Streptosporangiaceae bacterium]|nr:hypothetical protein [Streptosporangiaceae bacterium]